MRIGVTVMSHPKRKEKALTLLDALSKQGFVDASITWDSDNSEWDTGYRSWEYLSEVESDYSLVIQDDAVISESLYDNLVNAVKNMPSEGVLSLYLGKVKPHKGTVLMAYNRATTYNASYLTCSKLLWGVALLLPTKHIKNVLQASERFKDLYDVRLGKAASSFGLPIYYTRQSLVDHDDVESLLGHDVQEIRVAHKYQPDLIHSWNSKVINIF